MSAMERHSFDPMPGELLAPAWTAAIPLLADGEWHDWPTVISAMMAASPTIVLKTAEGLLNRASLNGDVVRKGVAGRYRDSRHVRFTRYGYERWFVGEGLAS